MPITTIIKPEKVSLARSPIEIQLTSNLPTVATPVNNLRLTINGSPAVDDQIMISYGNVSETFTVKTFADQSGNTLSVQGSLTLSEYAQRLADELNRNFNLFSNFLITYSPGAEEYVRLSPREDLSSSWSVDNELTNIDDDIIISNNPVFQPSPSLLLLVQIYNRDSQEYDIILPHILPSLNSQQPVTFDIHRDFDLAPHLPAPDSIGIGGDYISLCENNWIKYKLRWAERSGIPAITTALQSHEMEFCAVFGGNNYFGQYEPFWSFWKLNGKFLTAAPRTQVVTYEQPVWLYWIGRVNRTTVISGVATHRSGATTAFSRGEIDEVIGEVIVIKAGFTQLQLTENDSDPVVQYTVFLKSGSLAISEVFTFKITGQCHDWTRYFLFANSLGGCDTVRATGKHTTTIGTITQEGTHITNQKTIAEGHGDDFHYNRRSRVVYEGSVGHKSAGYVAYLQDMLNAPAAWLIDVRANRFNPILINAGDTRLFKDDEDLNTLKFSYAHAWEDAHIGIADDGQRIIVTENEVG
jgi:hypothetical protein